MSKNLKNLIIQISLCLSITNCKISPQNIENEKKNVEESDIPLRTGTVSKIETNEETLIKESKQLEKSIILEKPIHEKKSSETRNLSEKNKIKKTAQILKNNFIKEPNKFNKAKDHQKSKIQSIKINPKKEENNKGNNHQKNISAISTQDVKTTNSISQKKTPCIKQKDKKHKKKHINKKQLKKAKRKKPKKKLKKRKAKKKQRKPKRKKLSRKEEEKIKKIPIQIHHFATNKSKTWTPKMKKIADKYNLNLDGEWNKRAMHHQGRHPNKYHEFVLEGMKRAEKEAATNKQKFLELFNVYIIQPILENPLLLRKVGWKNK